jgi:hypothetical protein
MYRTATVHCTYTDTEKEGGRQIENMRCTGLRLCIEHRVPAGHVGQDEVVLPSRVPQMQPVGLAWAPTINIRIAVG